MIASLRQSCAEITLRPTGTRTSGNNVAISNHLAKRLARGLTPAIHNVQIEVAELLLLGCWRLLGFIRRLGHREALL
jgi:hypothetical protein